MDCMQVCIRERVGKVKITGGEKLMDIFLNISPLFHIFKPFALSMLRKIISHLLGSEILDL